MKYRGFCFVGHASHTPAEPHNPNPNPTSPQARIRQAQRSMSSAGSGGGSGSGGEGPQYYRRVLTGRENCALCIVASIQRYKVSEVLPVHPGCDCGFQPLPKGQDLFHVLDPELLERVHEVVEERTGESNRSADGYKDLLLTVNHSEHGEILSWATSKVKKKDRKPAEDFIAEKNPADAKYSRVRRPCSERKLRGKYLDACESISKIGAIPNGFKPPRFDYQMDIKHEDPSRKGLIRGAFYRDENIIRLNPNAKNIGLTPVHELGHAIDYFLGGNKGFASENSGSIPGQIVTLLRKTPTGQAVIFSNSSMLNMDHEIFARGYAQFVASFFPDSEYADEVREMNDAKSIRQWQPDEFSEVIHLFKQLFGI